MKKITLSAVAAALLLGGLFIAVPARAEDDTNPGAIESRLYYDENVVRAEFSRKKSLCLAKDGKFLYTLVYPDDAGETLLEAVDFLRNTLAAMTGDSSIEAIRESDLGEQEFVCVIDDTKYSSAIHLEGVEEGGYRIFANAAWVYIKGQTQESSANGLYGFLEDYLECLWATQDCSYIPNLPTIYLGRIDAVHNPAGQPALQWELLQNNWYHRLRCNGIGWDEESIPEKTLLHEPDWNPGDALGWLRPYLDARQLWNPDVDTAKLTAKYLTVTYGPADRDIARYLDGQSITLLEAAKTSENGDAFLLDKIERAQIYALYAKMNDPSWDLRGKETALAEFARLARRQEMERLCVWAPTRMEDYIEILYPARLEALRDEMEAAAACGAVAVSLGIVLIISLVLHQRKSNNY